ncbi:MAG: nucleotidyltransferase domain-containing protein [Candidatus Cloacimonadota bacterium]|nr:nucleotidyltransferase domain-containing protein [Candidatus Cloacimonadota bacterium]
MKINIAKIAKHYKEKVPEIEFAYIFGSATNGFVEKGSDVDISFYIVEKAKIDYNLINKILIIFEELYPQLNLDISFFNQSSVILAFEALSGKRLFVRESFFENFVSFFSLTAREYEDETAWRSKQLKIRGY